MIKLASIAINSCMHGVFKFNVFSLGQALLQNILAMFIYLFMYLIRC